MRLLTASFYRVWDSLPRTRMKGFWNYHLFPYYMDTWGGPFNGQYFRQSIFCELMKVCDIEAIVETGTYIGTSTSFMAFNAPSVPLYTSEADPAAFGYARARLKMHKNVHMALSDSRAFLRNLTLAPGTRIFCYLDAHWNQDLPLAEEMEIVARRFANFVVMIDDFEVPGDAAYSFDDYGPGKRLSLADFPFHLDPRLSVYFPACSGDAESGRKRGCVVLASESMAGLVDGASSLKRMAAYAAA